MWLIPLFLILLMPACAKEPETNTVINFVDSVKIVRELLNSNSLTQILENPEPEQLNFLINNFSPAEIAFESEVLNCMDRVILYCYQVQSDQNLIVELRQKYPDTKIMIINGDQFPFLMYDLEVENYPTILMVKQRKEIARLQGLKVMENKHKKV